GLATPAPGRRLLQQVCSRKVLNGVLFFPLPRSLRTLAVNRTVWHAQVYVRFHLSLLLLLGADIRDPPSSTPLARRGHAG
ncbi:hypothetical protein BaRGS_00009427, partial [Batillaria attramentaria]